MKLNTALLALPPVAIVVLTVLIQWLFSEVEPGAAQWRDLFGYLVGTVAAAWGAFALWQIVLYMLRSAARAIRGQEAPPPESPDTKAAPGTNMAPPVLIVVGLLVIMCGVPVSVSLWLHAVGSMRDASAFKRTRALVKTGDPAGALRALGYTEDEIYTGDDSIMFKLAEARVRKRPPPPPP